MSNTYDRIKNLIVDESIIRRLLGVPQPPSLVRTTPRPIPGQPAMDPVAFRKRMKRLEVLQRKHGKEGGQDALNQEVRKSQEDKIEAAGRESLRRHRSNYA